MAGSLSKSLICKRTRNFYHLRSVSQRKFSWRITDRLSGMLRAAQTNSWINNWRDILQLRFTLVISGLVW